jgi:hypothetical protein
MNSSARIFNSLPATTLVQQQNEEKLIIYIPQKGNEFAPSETNQQKRGLYTYGLNTCSGTFTLTHDGQNQNVFVNHTDLLYSRMVRG